MGRKTGGGTHIHCHNQFNCINRLVKLGEFRYYYILTDWLVYIFVVSAGTYKLIIVGYYWMEKSVWCERFFLIYI